MKFYARINTIVLFNKTFRLIQPYLSDKISWKRPKHPKNFNKARHRRCNTPKKMSQYYEFLLTLMRLRLGLLNEDLAERFGVSPTLCSYKYTTWIKLLSKVLGKASLREKCPNTEFFRVRIFLHVDLIWRFSPNTGKYGPEKTPY